MEFTIKTKLFNGIYTNSKIDLYIGSLLFNSNQELENKLIPIGIYEESCDKVVKELSSFFPDLNIWKISFSVLSRQLESFIQLKIKPDYNELQNALIKIIFDYLASEIGFDNKSKEDPIGYLKINKSRFSTRFIISTHDTVSNTDLIQGIDSFDRKQYAEALEIINKAINSSLNDYDYSTAELYLFKIRTKLEKTASPIIQELFENGINKNKEKPSLIKKYYFAYIKFLEDIREEKKPRELLREFEKDYPISVLDDSELSMLYYLRGRAEYGRGEYLVALKNFSSALQKIDKKDIAEKAKIFNSAVNSFTDNLFFDQARWIANQAKEFRSILGLAETFESISCQAGIETKSKNFKKALDLHLQADQVMKEMQLTQIEENRHYNYLAKNAIFCNMYDEAEDYLKKAEEAGDVKGFSKYLRLLLLFQKADYLYMEEVFNETIMLPENHKNYDNFVLGWGYALMARASFVQKEYRDAVLYLSDSINWFIGDLYILEAKIVSLYVHAFELPDDYRDIIVQATDDINLDQLFDEYVEKHAIIEKTYYKDYDSSYEIDEKTPNLVKLADDINHIYEQKNNAEQVLEIVDRFCLY